MRLAIITLISLLNDPDSYVYLNVLTVISKLADHDRHTVFHILLEAFSENQKNKSQSQNENENKNKNEIDIENRNEYDNENETKIQNDNNKKLKKIMKNLSITSKERDDNSYSLRHRALIGEALGTVVRRAGEAAIPYIPFLIPACITVVRVRVSTDEETILDGYVNMKSMAIARSTIDMNEVTNEEKQDEKNDENKNETRKKREKSAERRIVGGEKNSLGDGRKTEVAERVRERELEKELEKKRQINENLVAEYESKIISASYAADSVILRQSALSMLAEAVVGAGWIASKYLTDVLDIVIHIIALEGRIYNTQASLVMKR